MTPQNVFVLFALTLIALFLFFVLIARWSRNVGKPGTKAFGDSWDYRQAWLRGIRGAANKALERATAVTTAVPIAANAGVGPNSGDPLLVGVMAGVAINSDTSPTGVSTGNIAIDYEGAYFLSATAKSSLSPSVNKAINPGDPVYADGGTKDVTTNVTYGFTIDANSGGTFFGNSLDALTGGTTGVIRVRLPGAKAA